MSQAKQSADPGSVANDLGIALQGYGDAIDWAQRFKGEVESLLMSMSKGSTAKARERAMESLVEYAKWAREQADTPIGAMTEFKRNVVG
jgi:hypothetical protein